MSEHQPKELDNGFRRLTLGDVGSTNAVCLEVAHAGDPGGLWVTARRQLKGRGSRGRNWISEAGNLYASLLLRQPGKPEKLHTLTFVVSLAVRDAIAAIAEGDKVDVTLKWPNDVLLNGRKTSGILLESHEISGVRYVIAGMGVNIAHHPHGTLHPATHLQSEGIKADPDTLFELLNRSMEKRLVQWKGGSGFSQTRAAWLSVAAGIGDTIETNLPNETARITGTFQDMDDNGMLVLAEEGGRVRRISVADIFFT